MHFYIYTTIRFRIRIQPFSLPLSLYLQRSNGQHRRTTTEHNEIIDHGVEALAPSSPNRRNTHPQAPPQAVAQRRGTHQYPHSPQGDSNRFDPQRDHHALHLLLPLPFHHPHVPLQLFAIITIFFLSQIMDPFTVLSAILARHHLGLAVQERCGGPHGEDAAAGEGGQRVAGEVRGGVEEERVGV